MSRQLIQAIEYMVIEQDLAEGTDRRACVTGLRSNTPSKLCMSLGEGRSVCRYPKEMGGGTFEIERKIDRSNGFCGNHDRNGEYVEEVFLTCEDMKVFKQLCEHAQRFHDFRTDSMLYTYQWDTRCAEWIRESSGLKRQMSSLILDKDVEERLKTEIANFDSDDCKKWYREHSIPYRRGFLFHGPPGTGKSSTIAALAASTNSRIYRLNLNQPGLSDDGLISAVQNAENDSVIAIEDVDSFFTKHREKQDAFAVTFSGLLNALDGIGDNGKGLAFVLTTNHIERLDSALMRKGRIDVILKFDYCSRYQVRKMFLRFYPDEAQHADAFVKSVFEAGKDSWTCAELQDHFIRHRMSTAKEASVFEYIKGEEGAGTGMLYI